MTHSEPVTAPLKPRERRRRKNLARILDAAMDMVVEGGFDGLSVNRLAAVLDYTPGALYRYFDSKDALVAALVARVIEEIGADLRARAAADAAPLSRVVACASTWRAFAEGAPNRFGLVSMLLATPRLVLTDQRHTSPAVGAMLAAMGPVAAALEDAAAAGDLDAGAAVERSVLLFAGVHGILQLRKQARHAPAIIDLDRLFGAMLSTLLVGWGARPEAVAAALTSVTPAQEPSP